MPESGGKTSKTLSEAFSVSNTSHANTPSSVSKREQLPTDAGSQVPVFRSRGMFNVKTFFSAVNQIVK